MSLAWTKEPPTGTGFWWFRKREGPPWPVDAQPIEVTDGEVLLWGTIMLTSQVVGAEWAGPIEEPPA